MGTINIAGENLPFNGEILENQWTRVNLTQDDISYIYFIPEDNMDLLFFLKEVDYYEEEQGLYPNWASDKYRHNFSFIKYCWT